VGYAQLQWKGKVDWKRRRREGEGEGACIKEGLLNYLSTPSNFERGKRAKKGRLVEKVTEGNKEKRKREEKEGKRKRPRRGW